MAISWSFSALPELLCSSVPPKVVMSVDQVDITECLSAPKINDKCCRAVIWTKPVTNIFLIILEYVPHFIANAIDISRYNSHRRAV